MSISVTGSGVTRNGVNVTYYVSFQASAKEYYVQIRDADGTHTSAANPNRDYGVYASVSSTVRRTIYSPGAGSATQTGYYWYQSYKNGSPVNSGQSASRTVTWDPMPIALTFNANGGIVDTNSKTVTYDAEYGELPTPRRSGYKFLGWFINETGGTEIKATDTVKLEADTVLYAHWELQTVFRLVQNGSMTMANLAYIRENGNTKQAISIYIRENGVTRQGV